jgi:hypothetical protein
MLKQKSYNLFLTLGIPMIILIIVTILFSYIYGNGADQAFLQNLPSELIGVSIGVLITVFYVDQLFKKRDKFRWQSLNNKLFSSISSEIEYALTMLTTNINVFNLNKGLTSAVNYFIKNFDSISIEILSSSIKVKDIPYIMEKIDQHIPSILETLNFSSFTIDYPDLIQAQYDLKQNYKFLQSAVKVQSFEFTEKTQFTSDEPITLKNTNDLITWPLWKLLKSLVDIYLIAESNKTA